MSVVIEVLEAAISRRKKALAKLIEKIEAKHTAKYLQIVDLVYEISAENPKGLKELKARMDRFQAASLEADSLLKKATYQSKKYSEWWGRRRVLELEIWKLNEELASKLFYVNLSKREKEYEKTT